MTRDPPIDEGEFFAAIDVAAWKEESSVGWTRLVGNGQILLMSHPNGTGIFICGMPHSPSESRPSVFVPNELVAALIKELEGRPQ